MPVNPEYQGDYAKEVTKMLQDAGFRVILDDRNEKLGYRLRESQTKKIPYTLILGDNEKNDKTISYRLFGDKETTTLSQKDFIKLVTEEVATRKRFK